MGDGVGIWVDFDADTWLYIPMALPEGYKSPKKWAWDKSVEISEEHGLAHDVTIRLCKYLEHLAESSNEFEHRFVLLRDFEEPLLNVTIMFDLNEDEQPDISTLLSNEEADESLVPFFSENLGTGLKALSIRTKKRIFREDDNAYQFRYAFVPKELSITAHATHVDRDFLIRHEQEIDSLIKSVIAVA